MLSSCGPLSGISYDGVSKQAPGMMRHAQRLGCVSGGGSKRSITKRPCKYKSKSKYKSKYKLKCEKKKTRKNYKKLDTIINTICKSNKKCTPKYRNLLKKIIIKVL